MRIRITLRRIRIYPFTFTRIRIQIQLFILMRIRIQILLLIKMMGICDHLSIDPPRLHFATPASTVSVRSSPGLSFEPSKLLNLTLMRIRIQLAKIMRIRNPDEHLLRLCAEYGVLTKVKREPTNFGH
jgi:hypothetical protein